MDRQLPRKICTSMLGEPRDRRVCFSMLYLRSIAGLVFVSLLLALSAGATPVKLRVEHQTDPLAVAEARPRFGWQSDATAPGWSQSAYEIFVATRPARLAHPNVWDSGRLDGSASVDMAYAGRALAPSTRYAWQVRTWDAAGHAELSAPAWFETAPADLNATAHWIRRIDPDAEQELAATRWVWLAGENPMQVPSGQNAEFRYKLHLDKPVQDVMLHVIARGDFVTTVNGTETGRHDGWSAFDAEPITSLLHPGDNELIVHVSAGKPEGAATTPAAFAASLRILDAAGRQRRIGSGENWQGRTGTDAWQPVRIAGPLSMAFSTGVDRTSPVPGPARIDTGTALLRKQFTLSAKPVSARLSITALGSYRAFLNGNPVAGDSLLDPGFTDFRKRILYQTYDVTGLLHAGPNAIAAMLGGGWHGSPLTWQGTRFFHGPELLLAQLDVTLANGRHMRIVTDSTWKTADAPTLSAEIYGGEIYDARREIAHWSAAGFDDRSWPTATADPAPSAILIAQPDLSIHRTETLHPIAITRIGSNYVLDMGQNMVGNVALHVSGPRGTTVRMRFAERLNADGSVYLTNLRNAVATDFYTLSGVGLESWTPSFTFHGFRYVELSGFPGVPTTASVEGLVENSLPAAPSLRFHSSSDLLNSMGRLGFWGQRGNFFSIPTDCPQRDERLGWMGDAGVFWRTGTYNFDIASFTQKFMLDVLDAQQTSGDFSDVSPDVLNWGDGAPGWADAGVLVPYAAWLQYGDAATLERSWPQLNRFMDFIAKTNPGFLRVNHLGNNYADWLAPDPNTPKELIGTAYWAILARDMREMSLALHDDAHAAAYAMLYANIRTAYRKAYLLPDGEVKGDTQSTYVVTLYAGLEPEELRANMVQRLVTSIEAHANHLTTGFLGTPFLMFVLDENHRSDIAFKLLLQDTYPSWGYMVKKGATTWWERWNGDTGDPAMNSYNHYAFGSVMAWVFRRVAGIDSTDGSGYHRIALNPHFDPALPELHTEYDSPYGTITTDWKDNRYTVTLPANTTALLTLPGQAAREIVSGTSAYPVR
jgi:alpha-L-rhamnosidase